MTLIEWKTECKRIMYERGHCSENIEQVTDDLDGLAWTELHEDGLSPSEAVEHAETEWTEGP